MKVIKASEIKMEKTNTNFCTGEIMRQILLSANESDDYLMGIHTFPKGVRNKFDINNNVKFRVITLFIFSIFALLVSIYIYDIMWKLL